MPLSPQECERVFNGEQTLLVRKRIPKCDTPYEVLAYMTATKERCRLWEYITAYQIGDKMVNGSQKVIGSFVCRGIMRPNDSLRRMAEQSLLTENELFEYSNGKELFGLRITEPKLFDKPKELSDYWLYNDELHKRWEENNNFCCYDGTNEYGGLINECSLFNTDIKRCYSCWEEWSGWCHRITRPPHSWCYVEDV